MIGHSTGAGDTCHRLGPSRQVPAPGRPGAAGVRLRRPAVQIHRDGLSDSGHTRLATTVLAPGVGSGGVRDRPTGPVGTWKPELAAGDSELEPAVVPGGSTGYHDHGPESPTRTESGTPGPGGVSAFIQVERPAGPGPGHAGSLVTVTPGPGPGMRAGGPGAAPAARAAGGAPCRAGASLAARRRGRRTR